MDKRAIILILAIILFFANLGGLSIYILDEAKNSTAAKEMLNNGTLIIPTFNQQLRTDKPPLHYYFMMLSYSIFGINEFGARFFSAIAGVLTVFCAFVFTRKFVDDRAAFFCSLVLLSSIQVVIQFHMAVPDPYLILFFTMSVFFFYAGWKESAIGWYVASYSSLGLAVLAKGPVAIILFGAVVLVFLISQRSLTWKQVMALRPWLALGIISAIALPWYILVHIKTNGAWTEGFFLRHNISRFVAPMEGHGGSFLLIPVFAFMGLFPLSIFFPQCVRWFWKNRTDNSFVALAAIVSVVVLVFFCFSQTKLPNYISPALPFLAIVLGTFLSKQWNNSNMRFSINTWLYLILAISLPIAICIILEDVMDLPLLKNKAQWFLILPLGAAVALALLYRNRIHAAISVIAGSWMIVIFCFFTIVYPAVDKNNPVVKILQIMKGDRVPVYFAEKYNPSFSFYMQNPIAAVDTVQNLNAKKPFYVLSMKKKVNQPDSLFNRYKVVFQSRELFEPYYSVLLYNDAAVSSLH